MTSTACHYIQTYQNGVYLGEACFGGVLFPDEWEARKKRENGLLK